MTQPIPSRDQAELKLERLRHLATRRITTRDRDGKKLEQPNLDVLADRIHRHLDLDRTHPSRPDGYRTTASGADTIGGPATIAVTHDDDPAIHAGDVDLIPVTNTEAAVFARLRWKDEHREQTLAAFTHLVEAVHHLAAFAHLLDKLDNLAIPADIVNANDDQWCVNCLRYQVCEPRNLVRRTKTCTFCYDFKQLVGAYPPEELVLKHARHERVYDRDIAAHFPHYQNRTPA